MKNNLSVLFFLFLITNCFSQVNVDWATNIEFYSHNSSTYISANPAIDFTILNNTIFSITQNGNLSCINQKGEVLWKRKIINRENSNIYDNANIGTIDGENILITHSNNLKKYSVKGDLIWGKTITFSKKKYYINSILISSDNFIYITANLRSKYSMPLKKSFLLKYDTSGKLIWKQILTTNEKYDGYQPHKGIIEVNDHFFVFGNTQDDDRHPVTTIYKFSKKGKLVHHVKLDGYTKAISSKNNTIYVLTGSDYNTDYIKVTAMNTYLEVIDERKKPLTLNSYYLKENYAIDTLKRKITHTYYTKEPTRDYTINDFIVNDKNNFTIVGSSDKKLWITKLVNDTITFDHKMNRLYNVQNKNWLSYYQEFNTIKVKDDQFYISGISVNDDGLINNWIKLFIYNRQNKKYRFLN